MTKAELRNYKNIKSEKEELEKLEKIVNEKLELVRKFRDSFGWDCFTEEVEQEINVLRKLEDLLIFSREPDDLNEQVAELEDEDPKGRTPCGGYAAHRNRNCNASVSRAETDADAVHRGLYLG